MTCSGNTDFNSKKGQQNKKLLSQLDNCDQDVITGNKADDGNQNVLANGSPVNREFTVNSNDCLSTMNENAVNMKALENCFNAIIEEEVSSFVKAVEKIIENEILTILSIEELNYRSGQRMRLLNGTLPALKQFRRVRIA